MIRWRSCVVWVGASLPPEPLLCEEFGVSRTVVRDSLQMLAFEGLVKTERNRGAFVSNPSTEEARQVFASRRLIEAGVDDDAHRVGLRLAEDQVAAVGLQRLGQVAQEQHAVGVDQGLDARGQGRGLLGAQGLGPGAACQQGQRRRTHHASPVQFHAHSLFRFHDICNLRVRLVQGAGQRRIGANVNWQSGANHSARNAFWSGSG